MSNVFDIRRWHENNDNSAIAEDEQTYLSHEGDLVYVVPKVRSPLGDLIDRSRYLRTLSAWKKKDAPELPQYEDNAITYMSEKRVDSFTTSLTILSGLIMLIAPIWILQALSKPKAKLVTITIFIIVFLGMVSYITASKPSETLAATAA